MHHRGSTELQYCHACIGCQKTAGSTSARPRVSRTPPHTANLHFGGDRPVGDCSSDSNPHRCPLLASHTLERALTVFPDPLLVVVLGPTASGKTALSLALTERFHGEVVNCDSVALYRHFEIGTAKPTASQRARAPHHLLDIADPTDFITAGQYARVARETLAEIKSRNKLPIVVGGSGLYLRALLEGLFPGPPRSEELRLRLRERVRERGTDYLHKLLRRIDPAAAQTIHANDVPKVVRALEVSISARAPMTGLWQQGRDA